jgi:cytochrome c553
MKTRSLLISIVIGAAVIFFAAGIYAGTQAPEIIKMENKAYKEHTKGIVEFTHKKHAVDYAQKAPDLYKDGCGTCHHDDKGKPLTNLKDGDEVQSCFECHSKPGEKPKGKDAPKLSKQEELAYHAEAIHDNCRDCHKAFNKANNTKDAPTTCAKCHPKTN